MTRTLRVPPPARICPRATLSGRPMPSGIGTRTTISGWRPSRVVDGVFASGWECTDVGPASQDLVAHGLANLGEAGHAGVVCGDGGDGGEAVQQALAGGCGAPAPVLVRPVRPVAGPRMRHPAPAAASLPPGSAPGQGTPGAPEAGSGP